MKILKTASLGSNFNKKRVYILVVCRKKLWKERPLTTSSVILLEESGNDETIVMTYADKSSALVLLDREEQLRNNLAILRFMATSKTWIRTTDLYPAPRPWKTWTQKNRDPEKIGPWNADVKIAGCKKTIRGPHSMILWKLEIC